MLFLPSPWVSSKCLPAATRWTPTELTTRRTDTTKSRLRSLDISSRSDTRSILFHSSQSQDGLETTCSRSPITCHGIRDQPSWRPSTPSSHQRGQSLSHSDSHSRMSTRSRVSELSQSAESRLVSSSQVFPAPSDHSRLSPMSSPSRCITSRSQRLFQVTSWIQRQNSKGSDQERIRRLRHQEHPSYGYRVLQGPGYRHEPSRKDPERICPSS